MVLTREKKIISQNVFTRFVATCFIYFKSIYSQTFYCILLDCSTFIRIFTTKFQVQEPEKKFRILQSVHKKNNRR